MKIIRPMLHLLASRWRSWLGFELLFHLVLLSVVGPALKLTLDGAMALAGYRYLSYENVIRFLTTPAAIVAVLLLAVLLTLVSVIELAGMHYVFALDEAHGRPRVMDALRYALRRAAATFKHPSNLLLIPYLLLVLPFMRMGATSGMVRALDVPEFIMEYVQLNPVLGAAYIAVYLLLFILSFLVVFSTVYFVADDVSFVDALRQARAAGKHHYFGDLLRVSLLPMVPALVVALGLIAVAGVLMLLIGANITWQAIVLVGSALVSFLVAAPFSYAAMLATLQGRPGCEPRRPEPPVAHLSPVVMALAVASVTLACVAGGAFFLHQNVILPMQATDQLGGRKVVVTAHRGGSFGAPENTMAAFQLASDQGADVCELDVQMSKDGVIFVSHDSNFKRVSGVDKGAWELTWAQIQELDATGDYWKGQAEPQKYPLLSDVIEWAIAHDMRLNIELKPTGHETDFEKTVADIINAHNFGDQCIVTSQNYDTVARMKEYAPEATCTYVTALAYGDMCALDAADAFSIEETSATPSLVAYLHAHNKPVLTWVVNSEGTMEVMASNGVDNVITDDVPLARQVIDRMNELTPEEYLIHGIVSLLG